MPKPKTIWMVNPYAIPPTLPGGTRHYDFAVEMTRRGYRVEIFASDINLQTRKHNELKFGQLSKRREIDGVGFTWVNNVLYRKNNWRRIANFLSFGLAVFVVGLFRPRPAIIIGSTPHPFSALAGLFLARIRRAKFVLEVRDLWPQTLIEGGGMTHDSRAAKILRRLEKFLYKHAEQIVVFAKGSISHIEGLGIPAERILYIPNGVHLDQFKTSKDRGDAREALGIRDDQFAVLYAGAHGLCNALHTLIETAKLTRDDDSLLFVLVGDGPDKAQLVKDAEAAELTNVLFVDPVAKSEIPDVLNAADALAITLLDVELFQSGVSPNKLFDYMAIGRPVLCAVGGDMAEMVAEADAGLTVKPENPQDMADMIARLRRSPRKMEAFAANGPKYIVQHYSRQRLVEQLLEAIDPAPGDSAGRTTDGPEPAA